VALVFHLDQLGGDPHFVRVAPNAALHDLPPNSAQVIL